MYPMLKFKSWIKKPIVLVTALAVVLVSAAAVTCALAFGSETPASSAPVVAGEASGDGRAAETSAQPERDAPTSEAPASSEGLAAQPEESTAVSTLPEEASYTYTFPEVIDNWRYQGVYPDGVPIVTETQVRAVTPGMTWQQVYEGFGLKAAFPNGIAIGVEGNRLLLLSWSDEKASCGRTGEELLAGCLELWREDRPDGGRFVTFSDAAGLLLYDPGENRILFGEWSLPYANGGRVEYDTATGTVREYPSESSETPHVFDESGNPLEVSTLQNGAQGYAIFESLYRPEGGNGLLFSARIDRLTVLR
jgi:hypothetical protein